MNITILFVKNNRKHALPGSALQQTVGKMGTQRAVEGNHFLDDSRKGIFPQRHHRSKVPFVDLFLAGTAVLTVICASATWASNSVF